MAEVVRHREPTASADVDAELLSPAGVPSHCVLVSVSLHASQALLQAVSERLARESHELPADCGPS
jgi:hypothetical protein